jgi:hypothetical protein
MAEDGDPITLENMPRPHRRRREKKLMTMDEVNEKFPMMKYKSWIAQRICQGLPTEGGIDINRSRPNSIRSVDGVVTSKERESVDQQRTQAPADSDASAPVPAAPNSSEAEGAQRGDVTTTAEKDTRDATATAPAATAPTSELTSARPQSPSNSHHEGLSDDEDDEHIDAALPPECIGTSGDTCAICIDTLENDDDVRGLSCGHAFHAVCVDPWLTSRRACCPLCKADYYVPKPRPQLTDANGNPIEGAGATGRSGYRGNMPNVPPPAWYNLRAHGARFFSVPLSGQNQQNPRRARNRPRPARHANQFNRSRFSRPARNTAPASEEPNRSIFSRIRMPQLRGTRNNQQESQPPLASGANEPTPSQLEGRINTGRFA